MPDLEVLLDMNVLTWCYSPPDTKPKHFDPAKEVQALKEIAKLQSPQITFIYSERTLEGSHLDMNQVREHFPRFKSRIWGTANEFETEFAEFEAFLREGGERQDDPEVLLLVTMMPSASRIVAIVTLDRGFTNKIEGLRKRVCGDENWRRRICEKYPQFFCVDVLFPTQLLKKLKPGKL